MFNKNFYPTPREIISKMYYKLDRNLIYNILEPSAGKGDILDYIKEQNRYERIKNLYAIEIEPDLKNILLGKEYTVISSDFLTFKSYKNFDTIIMNPPFNEGATHLLKAIELLKNGGQIVCLLNEETIKNPYTNERKELLRQLEELNANIEYIGDVFKNAERKTNVNCAIVYLNIQKSVLDNDIFKNIKLNIAESVDSEYGNYNVDYERAVIVYDEITQLIKDYRTEVELYLTALHSINAYNVFARLRRAGDDGHNTYVSELSVSKTYSKSHDDFDEIIKDIRYRYWSRVLNTKIFSKYMTSTKMREIQEKLQKQSEIEFDLHNILEVKGMLITLFQSSLEQAAEAIFDEITQYHQTEYSKNIHYYNGWKTNKGSRINQKIIIPSYGKDNINELLKVLNYFDAFKAYDNIDIPYTPRAGIKYEHEYFDVQFFLKGTIHIWFKRIDLLDRFNLFIAQKRNWLPDENESSGEKERVKKEVCQHYKADEEVDCDIKVNNQLLIA